MKTDVIIRNQATTMQDALLNATRNGKRTKATKSHPETVTLTLTAGTLSLIDRLLRQIADDKDPDAIPAG